MTSGAFYPLCKSPFDVFAGFLRPWLKLWMVNEYRAPLTRLEWFHKGHQLRSHLWIPSTGAALVALKHLFKLRHKILERGCHVFVCQRLLWQEKWRRRLEKEMDA